MKVVGEITDEDIKEMIKNGDRCCIDDFPDSGDYDSNDPFVDWK